MSFGFGVGDFVAATQLATQTLGFLGSSDENDNSVIILSFRSLQAQRIKELQQELYQISLDRVQVITSAAPKLDTGVQADGRDTELRHVNTVLDVRLNEYGESGASSIGLNTTNILAAKAIRNYEILSQEALDVDSLIYRGRLHRSIRKVFGSMDPYKLGGMEEGFRKYLKDPNLALNFRELNKDIREAKMRKQAFTERIWMGALGGIAVIGPMLLMSLHRTLTTSLVTSSVAAVLFTLVLALGARNLKGQEVLGAVAAYAAVLVVFIGTSIPPIE